MFSSHSGRMLEEQAEGNEPVVPLHHERTHDDNQDASSSSSTSGPQRDGTWGENDGPSVDVNAAMQEFQELRTELSNISRTRTHKSQRSTATRSLARRSSLARQPDLESLDGEKTLGDGDSDVDEFPLSDFLREGHFEKRMDGQSAKKVGVVFKNLNVQGVGATSVFVKTLPQAILGTFGPDLYRILSQYISVLPKPGANAQKRDLIHDFTGVVRDGEMLLVLGRPGSGCSTFLKAITNKRGGYAGVSGEVHYGGISAEEQAKHFKGEVNYNEEDDQHFPSLTVEQTLTFSLMNKTKKHDQANIPIIVDALLKMFGISHTRHTLVGDVFVRGVSGGERKRVSIAETLATKSSVVAWDNSTRGLDASTALDYAKSLRLMTDISNRTTLVTLYQAGEDIYNLMDKVLVIDQGRMVYQGPAKEARAYFENLGYYAPPRQTTADFLTACTDPNERQFRKDFNGPIPKGPAELEKAFRDSVAYRNVLDDVSTYEKQLQDSNGVDAHNFKEAVHESKSRTVGKRSNYTVSFVRQVLACTRREFWLTLGDRQALYTKAFIIIANGLIVGSQFYGESLGTSGNFSRGGALFFSIVFLGWLQLSELMKAVSGRTIIGRHDDYAFYRPSAVVIARVLQDFPIILCQVVVFGIIMYFMTGLDVDAGKFFIYLLFVYVTTICLTALYRMFASLSPSINDAVRFAGLGLNLLVIYTGYVVPRPQLISNSIWFGWIYYIDPFAYAFEAVMTNEFADRTIQCSPEQIVPSGPGYNNSAYQGCAVIGAEPGNLEISGSTYLSASFEYTRSHLWRNFGVMIAWTVLYILVTAIATEVVSFTGGGGGAFEFKKSKKAQNKLKSQEAPTDIESGPISTSTSNAEPAHDDKDMQKLAGSQSIFTWKDVEYSVPYLGGQKKLLNKVCGYAKPGVMIALMGASGAGKSTLLNTLSQRQRVGVVSGEMLVDGKKLGANFQRGTGFVEQMDLHDGTATIREAIEFSAVLRQDASVPREEKIAYVDKIIALLELNDIEDALIRSLGVEQRKRVTIGVELAAKPSLLLFLDEPTSGLDAQSAYSIVRFLKKLSLAGQAILCTIHQPSSELVQQFDMILALNPGGNTFYFGPVGESGSAVINYFADRGIDCPPKKNVAEFILETAAKRPRGRDGKRIDWNKAWEESPEAQAVRDEIDRIVATEKGDAVEDDAAASFASSTWLQTVELTKRMFRQHWRDSAYLYGKLFVPILMGIFNGFTFWQLGDSITDMQDRMFSTFIIIVLPASIVNGVLPKFYMNLSLWGAREYPSRIYGWVAFTTANVVSEIPAAIVSSVFYFVLWYFPAGLPYDSSTAGYVFLMTMLFFIFQSSWGQWIGAFAPSFTVISNVLPFFFVMHGLFNGVVRPYSQMTVFWRYWIYYLNPATYWIGGTLAAVLAGTPVHCTDAEAAHFNPPPGQTCGEYANAFAQNAGGYVINPAATSNCGYCAYENGTEYLAGLNISPSDKWRDFGIYLAFVISNWALVYFFVYTVRIRGWSFGLGFVFGTLGKAVDIIFGLFKSKKAQPEA